MRIEAEKLTSKIQKYCPYNKTMHILINSWEQVKPIRISVCGGKDEIIVNVIYSDSIRDVMHHIDYKTQRINDCLKQYASIFSDALYSGWNGLENEAHRALMYFEFLEYIKIQNDLKAKAITDSFKKSNPFKITPNDKQKTYLIKNKRNGFYKIGKSKNPSIREKTLQSEEPLIKIVKVWGSNIEKELHQQFKQHRIRGEWFELTSVQVRHICTKY